MQHVFVPFVASDENTQAEHRSYIKKKEREPRCVQVILNKKIGVF